MKKWIHAIYRENRGFLKSARHIGRGLKKMIFGGIFQYFLKIGVLFHMPRTNVLWHGFTKWRPRGYLTQDRNPHGGSREKVWTFYGFWGEIRRQKWPRKRVDEISWERERSWVLVPIFLPSLSSRWKWKSTSIHIKVRLIL